jgi:hypothetical protein
MVSAEVKWSGREDQVFNVRKIQIGCLSVAVYCLQLSLLVMGKKAMGLNGIWLPNVSFILLLFCIVRREEDGQDLDDKV